MSSDWSTVPRERESVSRSGVRITRSDIEAIERLSDAAIRAGSYETAVEGYALALRLRSETGFHPLRRESDEPVT